MNIRQIKFRDIPRITEIAIDAHKFSAYKDIPYNAVVFKQFLVAAISQGAGWVSVINGKVEGVMIAGLAQWYFTDSQFATDRYFLTTDKGSGTGAFLLRRFVRWAKKQDISAIVMEAGADTPNQERLNNMYEKCGLRNVGNIYQMEI